MSAPEKRPVGTLGEDLVGSHSLQREFVTLIFLIMAISVTLFSLVLVLLQRLNLLDYFRYGFFWPILAMYVLSAALAAVLSIYVSRKVLRPVVHLAEASARVSEGDFSVRLDEKTDVMELRMAVDHFNNMVRDLGATETLRSDFVANVSHEFKTPLAAVEGYAMLLQDHTLTEAERDEYVGKILASVGRLSTLAGNILLLSKLENQTLDPECSTFSLDEQVRQAILLLEPKWSEKSIEPDVDLDEVTYYGNEGLLSQVWLNLVGNAIKFTLDGGDVSVRLRRIGETSCVVTVADSGIGMDAEMQKHIFEKFYQGDASHRSEGNGLGLALCRRIVDSVGGEISVWSEPGRGSAFTVTLPLRKQR